ncbi:SCO1/SenC-domain-containing protein [Phycomyces blakesleeanus]|uniref:SCO1/SenC-domain-containing protein n=1 Tax=Phycomyces blakesleeanus TaxID=4837 RepID=A0ABR3ASZ1_PHYBL
MTSRFVRVNLGNLGSLSRSFQKASQNRLPATFAPRRFYATTEEKMRTKSAIGPFTWKAATVFIGTGIATLIYFDREKKKSIQLREEKKIQEKSKSYGKPKLGGPFKLTNAANNEEFDSESLRGRFHLIYFGFTHCPDICPEELDKMSEVVEATKKDKELGEHALVPIFITCDPRRDTAPIVKEYVKDFHPDLIGLTGSQEEIKKVAKLFRVYVSSPPALSEDDDYLVDHSIFFYLMSPEGVFLDCYSQNATPESVLTSFKKHYQDYVEQGGQVNDTPL